MEFVPGPATEYGKELAKWNVKRPYQEFPKMMYRARQRPDGKWSVGEVMDSIFGGAPGAAESWSNGCHMTVNSESERDRAMGDGWRDHPKEAMEHQEALQKAIADAAAERAYSDKRMSERARAEAAQADSEAFEHLPVVPEKRKPGRPKAAPVNPES